jgi:hypothetical protein
MLMKPGFPPCKQCVVDPDPEPFGQVGFGSGKIISNPVLEPDPRLKMTYLP